MSAINLGQPENYFLLTKIISGCCTLMQGIIVYHPQLHIKGLIIFFVHSLDLKFRC